MSGSTVVTIYGDFDTPSQYVKGQWTCNYMASVSELSQGLSGISSIPAGTGMLFDVSRAGGAQNIQVQTHSMLFPLDIAFIQGIQPTPSGMVGGTGASVSALSLGTPIGITVTDNSPALYFMEVNAGELTAAGVSVGDQVSFAVPVQSAETGIDIPTIANLMITMMIVVMMMGMMGGMMKSINAPSGYIGSASSKVSNTLYGTGESLGGYAGSAGEFIGNIPGYTPRR